jgi:hypothetical protein
MPLRTERPPSAPHFVRFQEVGRTEWMTEMGAEPS